MFLVHFIACPPVTGMLNIINGGQVWKAWRGVKKTLILPKYNLIVYLLMNIYYTDEK